MLHDPEHISPMPSEEEIVLNQKDKDILKSLGEAYAAFGEEDERSGKQKLWKKLNDLDSKRPMVWINEIPWHEMDVDGELELKCEHPWARKLEQRLKREIYQRKHLPTDMVVSPYIECEKVFHSSDFGIVEKVETVHTDAKNEIYSRHFEIQIKDPEDIEKIKMPKITYLEKATQYSYEAMKNVFEGICPVKLVGQKHIWYTPWDYLVRWWGVSEAMMDLVIRPEMVKAAYKRMVDAWCIELDQFERLNLLSLDCNNTRIGSGGYGYVSSLPGEDYDKTHVYAKNMWGCANAQIFSCVSENMHWEFALEHDQKWLSRFGLTYYGCCEPLDKKVGILRKIKNLRKISVSSWCDKEKICKEVDEDYVMSYKPSPAIFATGEFDERYAKKELTDFLEKAKGGHTEIIMKDISTVAYKPENLWKWAQMAVKTAEQFAK